MSIEKKKFEVLLPVPGIIVNPVWLILPEKVNHPSISIKILKFLFQSTKLNLLFFTR